VKDGRIKALLWTIYLILLAVLLPHTAWAAGRFEPDGWTWLGWAFAFAFELAIAALTWRLKQVIETTRKVKGWRRWVCKYLNWYSVGLLASVAISAAANWAHAVEFGTPFKVFSTYGIPPLLYSVAFGAILPLCSFLFAHILADTDEAEPEQDAALVEARGEITRLKHALRETEQRAIQAEQRFQAVGDLAVRLFSAQKSDRILAAHQLWPELPQRSIALIADTSPGHVSDTLSKNGAEH